MEPIEYGVVHSRARLLKRMPRNRPTQKTRMSPWLPMVAVRLRRCLRSPGRRMPLPRMAIRHRRWCSRAKKSRARGSKVDSPFRPRPEGSPWEIPSPASVIVIENIRDSRFAQRPRGSLLRPCSHAVRIKTIRQSAFASELLVLKVKFWGVRGSIPTPLTADDIASKIDGALQEVIRRKVRTAAGAGRYLKSLSKTLSGTYGGNTSCVTVSEGEEVLILDAGTGLRRLGQEMVGRAEGQGRTFRLLLSHFHWDHLMGFAFFAPAFIPGNRITVYTPKARAKVYFQIQHSDPFFPVELEHMGADVSFVAFQPGRKRKVGHFDVRAVPLSHPGGGLGYRIQGESGSVVYLTDTELELESPRTIKRYAEFAEGADVAIVDSQYGILDTIEKRHWGHSSIFRFIDVLNGVGVRRLVMFHYDPTTSDAEIDTLVEDARKYAETVYPGSSIGVEPAVEGQEIRVCRRPRKD